MQGAVDNTAVSFQFSHEELSLSDPRVRIGVLVALVIIAVLAAVKLCYDHRNPPKEEPAIAGGLSSRPTSPVLHVEGHDGEYDEVQEEESDAGDWQVDELVNAGLGYVLGGKGESTRNFDRPEYKAEGVSEHIQKTYTSWKLLRHIMGALVEFWAALAFMYWSLYREEEIMDCKAYGIDLPHSFLVRHACYYTLACLRGFPIFAANMVLVLMIRIIIQTRMYYSMLKLGYVLHFVSAPVMRTLWPWACGLSMFQGGMHFAVKIIVKWYLPSSISKEEEIDVMYVRLVRKFVLPGTIFFSFLLRYADIENTLVPLNRICEQDFDKSSRSCPWLGKIQVLNERVLAFDARHRDVVGAARTALGKKPSLQEIVQNMLDNYEQAHKFWQRRSHRDWGLFRSMWPASVLLDRRIDRHDPDTFAWLCAWAVLCAGCFIVSMGSLYLLFFKMLFTVVEPMSETLLADFVLVNHGLLIMMFIYRTIRNMFYFAINEEQKQVLRALDGESQSNAQKLSES